MIVNTIEDGRAVRYEGISSIQTVNGSMILMRGSPWFYSTIVEFREFVSAEMEVANEGNSTN